MEFATQSGWKAPTPNEYKHKFPNLPDYLHFSKTCSSVEDRCCTKCGKVELNLQEQLKKALDRELRILAITEKFDIVKNSFWLGNDPSRR
jgi:hypothetical protein